MTHLPRQPLRAGLAAFLVAATLAGAGLAQDVPTTQGQPEAAAPAAPQPAADGAAPARPTATDLGRRQELRPAVAPSPDRRPFVRFLQLRRRRFVVSLRDAEHRSGT